MGQRTTLVDQRAAPGGTPGDDACAWPTPGWAGVGVCTLGDLAAARPSTPYRLTEHHLLVLVTAGHGSYEVDFQAHPCRPGTLIVARPGQAVRCGGQPGLDAVLVGWDIDLPDSPTAGCWQLAGEDEDAVINEVSQLVVDCRRRDRETDTAEGGPATQPGRRVRAAELVRRQLAVLVLRLALLPGAPAGAVPPGALGGAVPPGAPGGAVPPDAPAGGPAAEQVATYLRFSYAVERDYHRVRRVEHYAQRLACSVRTLTRACLTVTGRSAKQVIDDRVTLQARRLLAATQTPVAEVGRRLGFPEPTNFGRFFHRETGDSPGAFRAAVTASVCPPAGTPPALGHPAVRLTPIGGVAAAARPQPSRRVRRTP